MLQHPITDEIRLGDTSVPYISARWPCISHTVMPLAYRYSILLSNPVQLVWCLGMSCGSKLP